MVDDNFASDSKVEMPGAEQLIKAIALIIVVSLLFGLVGLGYLSLIYLFSLWNSGRNAQGCTTLKRLTNKLALFIRDNGYLHNLK